MNGSFSRAAARLFLERSKTKKRWKIDNCLQFIRAKRWQLSVDRASIEVPSGQQSTREQRARAIEEMMFFLLTNASAQLSDVKQHSRPQWRWLEDCCNRPRNIRTQHNSRPQYGTERENVDSQRSIGPLCQFDTLLKAIDKIGQQQQKRAPMIEEEMSSGEGKSFEFVWWTFVRFFFRTYDTSRSPSLSDLTNSQNHIDWIVVYFCSGSLYSILIVDLLLLPAANTVLRKSPNSREMAWEKILFLIVHKTQFTTIGSNCMPLLLLLFLRRSPGG